MSITISKTFTVAAIGADDEPEDIESGFMFEDEPYSFRQLVDELSGFPHPSCSHGTPRWVTDDGDQDLITGEITTCSLHPGRDAQSQRYWAKACRAAGINV